MHTLHTPTLLVCSVCIGINVRSDLEKIMLCKSMLCKDWIYKEPKSRTSAVTLQTTRRLCVACSRVVGDLVLIRFRDSVRFGQFAKTNRSGIVRSFSRVFGSGELNHRMHSSQTLILILKRQHYNFNQTQRDRGVVDYWMFNISAR